MALNPQLFPGSALPVPFYGETLVLAREGVEFQVDNLGGIPGGSFSGKGSVYLSSVRVVFVPVKPSQHFTAFDIPLAYVFQEAFNQPIFGCNNLAGKVYPVVQDTSQWTQSAPHDWKIYFKEGGCGTFIPLFFTVLRGVRARLPPPPLVTAQAEPTAPLYSPIPESHPPVDQILRSAYVDPNDPSRLYVQQPFSSEEGLRRRNYQKDSNSEAQ